MFVEKRALPDGGKSITQVFQRPTLESKGEAKPVDETCLDVGDPSVSWEILEFDLIDPEATLRVEELLPEIRGLAFQVTWGLLSEDVWSFEHFDLCINCGAETPYSTHYPQEIRQWWDANAAEGEQFEIRVASARMAAALISEQWKTQHCMTVRLRSLWKHKNPPVEQNEQGDKFWSAWRASIVGRVEYSTQEQ